MRYLYHYLTIAVVLLCVSVQSKAQESISYQNQYMDTGLQGSLNIGAFFADKNTANFYSGSNTAEGMNNAERVLHNPYYLNDINATLEQNGYRYPLIEGYFETEYPVQMHYKIAMTGGIGLRYWITPRWAVTLNTAFARLHTTELLLIHNTNPNLPPSNKENHYVKGYVSGTDNRVQLDLGVESKHIISENIYLLMGTGFNLNNTTVQTNKIEIYDLILDIKYRGPHDYVPNGTQQQYNFRQGGIGFGMYLSPGLEFVFLNNISVDIMAYSYYSKINLQNYDNWGLHFMPHIRFNLSNLLF